LRTRRDRPLFIIDLAIPRDVEPTVHELDDVYVYDLDSLHAIADRTLQARKKEMDACDSLIDRYVNDFQVWLNRAPERVIPPAAIERRQA
jgi:glutamyl-tRNA reductase